MPFSDDDIRFEGGTYGLTTNAVIVRDDPEILIYATRSRNVDHEWEVRSYSVKGLGVKIEADSRFRAEVAAAIVERFDDGEDALSIQDRHSQWTPMRNGVPTVVAVDGLTAIIAWRFAMGDDRAEIAAKTSLSQDAVDQKLEAFCPRVTGFPDSKAAPEVGEELESVPERYSLPIPRTEERCLKDFAEANRGGA